MKKCKWCDNPAKKNMQGTRNKGHYKTCGSTECLRKQYDDPCVNKSKSRSGKAHHFYHEIGSKRSLRNQYTEIKVADPDIWQYEHRVIAEQTLGRKLEKGELIHHINMDKLDNRPANLYVYKSMGEHTKGHFSLNSSIKQLIETGLIKFKEGEYHAL